MLFTSDIVNESVEKTIVEKAWDENVLQLCYIKNSCVDKLNIHVTKE